MMLDTLKPISVGLIKELNSIDLSRKVLIDHFNNDLKFAQKIILLMKDHFVTLIAS